MIRPMKERVLKYDAKHWAGSFIGHLAAAHPAEDLPVAVSALTAETLRPLKRASRPALFLDYDGTLAGIRKTPAEALPDEPIERLFRRLERTGGLDTYLISGRKRDDLDQWFSHYHLNLIAEHGYYHKLLGAGQWTVFDPQADLGWKLQIIDIFQLYTGMTPGSTIEEKTSSVVWHYRNSDPEFGTWKANQLVSELYEMLANVPVEIRHGRKIVEIGSIQVNKGIVMEHFVHENNYDAVLCAGDDETDESMFRMADERCITVKVGRGGETAAHHRAAGPEMFRDILMQYLESL